jgi:threonine dehydrogenase-like Zn-dependent dehydrogenase
MNKGLTVRGAQMHGQRYIPMLLERIAAGVLDTRHLVTHPDEREGARSAATGDKDDNEQHNR